jgi:hypothetical protein
VVFSLKRKLVIVIALLAVAAFAGGAYASTQETTNPQQAFLNDVAQRLHVSPAALAAGIKGAYLDQINAGVASGKITQAQAKALKQRLDHMGALPLPFGFGSPPPRFLGPPRTLATGPELSAAASYLGLSQAQLLSDLKDGKSLAKIAAAQHKSTSGLEGAITASIRSKLEQLVSKKRITQAQANQILKGLTARVGRLVKGDLRPGFGPGSAFGPGGPHQGWNGPPPAGGGGMFPGKGAHGSGGAWTPPGNAPYAPPQGGAWMPPGNGPHAPAAPGKPASAPGANPPATGSAPGVFS